METFGGRLCWSSAIWSSLDHISISTPIYKHSNHCIFIAWGDILLFWAIFWFVCWFMPVYLWCICITWSPCLRGLHRLFSMYFIIGNNCFQYPFHCINPPLLLPFDPVVITAGSSFGAGGAFRGNDNGCVGIVCLLSHSAIPDHITSYLIKSSLLWSLFISSGPAGLIRDVATSFIFTCTHFAFPPWGWFSPLYNSKIPTMTIFNHDTSYFLSIVEHLQNKFQLIICYKQWFCHQPHSLLCLEVDKTEKTTTCHVEFHVASP